LINSTTQFCDTGFKKIMLSFRSFFATALLLTTVPVSAKELGYYDSLRLVSAMREDEVILRMVRADRLQGSRLNQQDLQCLDSLEYPELTEIVAKQIGYMLTAAEVQDALNYFQSSSGRKFVRRALGILGETQFTTLDQAELERFKQRPAGRKLLGDRIFQDPAFIAEAAQRVDQRLGDCAFARQNDLEREIPETNCQARAVPSSDNVCLATYGGEGSAKKFRRASVEVNCREGGRVLTSRIGLMRPEDPIALRWSAERELQILIDGKVKNSPTSVGSVAKISFASWRKKNDPPLLTCITHARSSSTLANTLPSSATVGGWRAYSRAGLCLMTARVPKDAARDTDGDVLLQFRQQKPAAVPFATTDLALVVEIDQQSDRPLFVDFETRRFALIAQPPRQRHMLTGMAAEVVLDRLRAKPVDLTVSSDDGAGYSIPMRGLDFDFANAEFGECLATLAAT
jgi:hypothetical protein